MRTRTRIFAPALLLLLASACNDSTPTEKPTIALTPPGPVMASGPVHLVAQVMNGTGEVSWSVTGAGTLSDTKGNAVLWSPSASAPGGSATVTATALGASASVQINFTLPQVTAKHIPGLSAPVIIRYDARDIPHLRCAQRDDCLAVQGYLQARDRLFMMDFLRRVAEGRLSELIGALGLAQDLQLRTIFTTRDGKRLEEDWRAQLSESYLSPITAYTRGVNAYLQDLKAGMYPMSGEYAQLPVPLQPVDIPDWRVEDTLAIARLQQFQLSESLNEEMDFGAFAAVYGPGGALADPGKMHTWIRSAAPPSEQTHTLVDPATSPQARIEPMHAPFPVKSLAPWSSVLQGAIKAFEPIRKMKPLAGSYGSNNWVVDGAHSSSGKAMVANDPHLPLQYPPLFHLITMTSSNANDTMNIAGGSFPGIPGALVGRGEHVGWGVTVVGYDVTDVYLEQAVPPALCPRGTPSSILFCVIYKRDTVPVMIYPQKYMVRVASGPGGLKEANDDLHLNQTPFVLIVPHHGPVIQAPDTQGHFLSVRWSGQEVNTNDLAGFLGMATAKDVDDAMGALKNYTTGAQNFVLADDQGNIAYDPHALVPVRNFADPSLGTPIPPWLPIPGDGTAEWGSGLPVDHCAGAGANSPARACWIPDDKLPHGKNPAWGFFATANADPVGSSDSNNPLLPQYQPYLSFDWDDSSGFRHARISHRLSGITHGGGKVSLDDMMSIQADHVVRMADLYVKILGGIAQAAPANALPADYMAALELLKQWQSDGLDCPSGLVGIDPAASPADPDMTKNRDSAACYLFHVFVRTLLKNVFEDDISLAGVGYGLSAIKGMLYMFQPTTPMEDQTFCNDVDPANGKVIKQRTCAEQAVIALVTAYDVLFGAYGPPANWLWGRVHTIQPVPLLPLVTTGFMPGPYARPGGFFTVDVGNPGQTQSLNFPYGAGGNVRHISVMDAASPVVKMQLPGPERDAIAGIFSGKPDMLVEWVKNQYFDFAYDTQVYSSAVSMETFQAP